MLKRKGEDVELMPVAKRFKSKRVKTTSVTFRKWPVYKREEYVEISAPKNIIPLEKETIWKYLPQEELAISNCGRVYRQGKIAKITNNDVQFSKQGIRTKGNLLTLMAQAFLDPLSFPRAYATLIEKDAPLSVSNISYKIAVSNIDEEWKETMHKAYSVSNQGRVKNRETGRVLTPCYDPEGYAKVLLEKKTYSVHRLVLLTFEPRPDAEEFVVNHKNGKKSDNNLSNLEWMTQQQNSAHAKRIRHMQGSRFEIIARHSKTFRETIFKNIQEAAVKLKLDEDQIYAACGQGTDKRRLYADFYWKRKSKEVYVPKEGEIFRPLPKSKDYPEMEGACASNFGPLNLRARQLFLK